MCMLLLTVQKYKRISELYTGSYQPDFLKSRFSCLSPLHTRAYYKILDNLSKKTNRYYTRGKDSCFWGWLGYNPYLSFFQQPVKDAKDNRYYGVFVNVPENAVVVSDYDKFTAYINGYSKDEDYLCEYTEDKQHCYQGSFWGINKRDIAYIVDLSELVKMQKKGVNSVEDLYLHSLVHNKDESHRFDISIDSFDLPFRYSCA